MPPARRPPTGNPTVTGAPVDPAIISSQIARPNGSSQEMTSASQKLTEKATTTRSEEVTAVDTTRESTKALPPPPNAAVASGGRPNEPAKAPTPSATANVETVVRDAFKTFANLEKTKLIEDRRKRVSQDKAIKLNDLKKFSTNFKLHTPVPKDLVPILAKDTAKQHEIVEKAQREAEQKVVSPPKAPTSSGDPSAASKYDGTRAPPNTAVAERHDYTHPRQGFPPRGPQAGLISRDKQQQFSNMFAPASQTGQGMLGHRLADRHKSGMPVPIPTPLPIHSAQKPPSRPSVNAGPPPSSQASSTVRTPTSAVSTQFNVKAPDFKPNPAASAFKPTGEQSAPSSPRSTPNARPLSRKPTASDFFGNKKPLPPGERPSILDNFNPLKRLREKAQNENQVKNYASNGGILFAHATPVTWTQVDDPDRFKHYKDMFEEPPPASRAATPQHPATSPANVAHLHQLPPQLQPNLQAVPQVQAPQHPQYQGQPQPHHYPSANHYEEHRMHASPSAPSPYSTPRVQAPYLAYPQAVGQPMPYPSGQPMPPYTMGPGVQQPQHFRPYHGGAPFPHSPGQQFTAPMMVQNSSQGSYMGPHPVPGPQVHMYPPGHVPHYAAQSQPPSGFPSPGRATPMMPQGPYPGQYPQMYMTGQHYGPVYVPQPPQSC